MHSLPGLTQALCFTLQGLWEYSRGQGSHDEPEARQTWPESPQELEMPSNKIFLGYWWLECCFYSSHIFDWMHFSRDLFLFMCMHVCLCVCMCMYVGVLPGATRGCQMPWSWNCRQGAGNRTQVFYNGSMCMFLTCKESLQLLIALFFKI